MGARITRPDGPDRLAAELTRLAGQDHSALRGRFRRVFGRAAPAHLSRAQLHRVLAYRMQADALGDLDRETARALDRLGTGTDGAIAMPEQPGTKPGTLLVREWEGTLQRVMVLERGYAWNGQTYDSLSRVARAITGTAWNGPRFFGLRNGRGGDRSSDSSGRSGAGSQDQRTAAP